jgi:hypothetical protein
MSRSRRRSISHLSNITVREALKARNKLFKDNSESIQYLANKCRIMNWLYEVKFFPNFGSIGRATILSRGDITEAILEMQNIKDLVLPKEDLEKTPEIMECFSREITDPIREKLEFLRNSRRDSARSLENETNFLFNDTLSRESILARHKQELDNLDENIKSSEREIVHFTAMISKTDAEINAYKDKLEKILEKQLTETEAEARDKWFSDLCENLDRAKAEMDKRGWIYIGPMANHKHLIRWIKPKVYVPSPNNNQKIYNLGAVIIVLDITTQRERCRVYPLFCNHIFDNKFHPYVSNSHDLCFGSIAPSIDSKGEKREGDIATYLINVDTLLTTAPINGTPYIRINKLLRGIKVALYTVPMYDKKATYLGESHEGISATTLEAIFSRQDLSKLPFDSIKDTIELLRAIAIRDNAGIEPNIEVHDEELYSDEEEEIVDEETVYIDEPILPISPVNWAMFDTSTEENGGIE